MLLYATLLLSGDDGVGKDEAAAERLLRKGVAIGDTRAMQLLYSRLVKRPGAKGEAIQVLRTMADYGIASAQHQLGLAYAQGKVAGRPNRDEAVKWLRRAKAQGCIEADKALSSIDETMRPAVELYEWEQANGLEAGDLDDLARHERRLHKEGANEVLITLLQRLQALQQIKQRPDATPTVDASFSIDPAAVRTMLSKAAVGSVTAQRWREAMQYLLEAVNAAEKQDDAEVISCLARSYRCMDFGAACPAWSSVQAAIDRYLPLHPHDPDAVLCWALWATRSRGSSIATIKQTLKTVAAEHPQHADILQLCACIHMFESATSPPDYSLAEGLFNKVVSLDPTDTRQSDIRYLRGKCFEFQNKLAEAAADYRVFLATMPEDNRKYAECCYSLACVLSMMDQKSAEGRAGKLNPEIKAWFEAGVRAEACRLPVFEPCGILTKDMMKMVVEMWDIKPMKEMHRPDGSATTPAKLPTAVSSSRCASCNKQGSVLSRCTACHAVHYCSKECQRAHWAEHKEQCRKAKQEKA